MWAVLASPLLLSADLRTVKERHPECLELMLNREIIAVNQVSPNLYVLGVFPMFERIFWEFSLCLSRARLGKMISFSITWYR